MKCGFVSACFLCVMLALSEKISTQHKLTIARNPGKNSGLVNPFPDINCSYISHDISKVTTTEKFFPCEIDKMAKTEMSDCQKLQQKVENDNFSRCYLSNNYFKAKAKT